MLSRLIPRRSFAVIRMRGASKVDKEGMPETIHGTKTYKKLRELFLHECASAIRYKIFADKAELEGYTGIADLFNALGKSEQKQAEFLYRFIEEELSIDAMNEMETGSTINLLKIAVADEVKDSKERYVQAARTAFEEDLAWVNQMLHSMADSESRHLEVLKLTLDDVLVIEKEKEKGKDYVVKDHLRKEDKDSDDEEEDEDEFEGGSDFDFSDEEDDDEDEDTPPRGESVRSYSDFKKMQKKGASLKPSKKKK